MPLQHCLAGGPIIWECPGTLSGARHRTLCRVPRMAAAPLSPRYLPARTHGAPCHAHSCFLSGSLARAGRSPAPLIAGAARRPSKVQGPLGPVRDKGLPRPRKKRDFEGIRRPIGGLWLSQTCGYCSTDLKFFFIYIVPNICTSIQCIFIHF